MTSRFTHLFKARSKEHSLLEKVKVLFGARKEVDINGEGTSGYVVKHGTNKGKVLAHRVVKSTNNW
jgi:ABC-type siderophore export system fused ATPase/permease subunit